MSMFNALSLMVSMKCNEWCTLCDFGLTDEQPNSMSAQEATGYIGAIHALSPTLVQNRVEIIGGEPFLQLPELLDIVRYSSNLGFETEVVTNGYWADTDEQTRSIIDQLRQAGLSGLTLVVDAYHLQFISLNNIDRLMASLREANYPVNGVYRVMRTGHLSKSLLDLDSLNAGITSIFVSPWMPLGYDDEQSMRQFFVSTDIPPAVPCKQKLRLVILPGGNVAPCVTGSFKGLHRIGNLEKVPMATIMEHIQNDRLFLYLQDNGPTPLASFLEKRGGHHKLQSFHTNTCHLCYDIFSQEVLTETVREGLFSEL